MTDAPQILLQHHLKKLRLPTFQGEYAKQAQLCAAENKDHVHFPPIGSKPPASSRSASAFLF